MFFCIVLYIEKREPFVNWGLYAYVEEKEISEYILNKDCEKLKALYIKEFNLNYKKNSFGFNNRIDKKSIRGLKEHFTYIECSNDKTRGKPFPDQINLIISRLKVDKSECVYIGDTLVDYNTAKNAGIDFIFAQWGYGINYNYKYKCKEIKNLSKLIKQ